MPEIRTETMTVNMGPQHPSTHGVLRLVLELDGETIVSLDPTIGYLHTGIEKTCEQKKWQQVIPLVERMDYLGPQSNSLAFCLSVERLLGIETAIPDRVIWIRVLIAELQRLSSHLVWLGTHGMEIGAISVMMYCFREREQLLNLNEMLAGFRMFPSYIADRRAARGSCRADSTRRSRRFSTSSLASSTSTRSCSPRTTSGCAGRRASASCRVRTRLRWASSGPIARAVGIPYDVRKTFPYLQYETFDFIVPTRTDGDVFARYSLKVEEMRESVKICQQALSRISPTGVYDCGDYRIVPPPKDRVYTEMEALIQHFLLYSQGFNVPKGECYVPVEGPRGEQGFYIVSDGGNRPVRVKSRAPSFLACQALGKMVVGGLVADLIAVIGSTDVVMGDVDR